MTAFGSVFMPEMTISWYDGSDWSPTEFVPSNSLNLNPAAHVLHYSSTCFEGLKAFRHTDGSVKIFRMDKNLARFSQSTDLLGLPKLDLDQTKAMIVDLVRRFQSEVPAPPGSMYIRPTHIGTEPCVGKAAAPSLTSCQYILLSPVGSYFANGDAPLRLLIEEDAMRCSAHMGVIKSGGNYASALLPTLNAKRDYKVDQVLFCPGGDVQETGAANFLLIDGNELITKALDASFLHGITRDSILTLARDMGMDVQERSLSVDELLERAQKPGCEVALSGTAAVLTSVGTLVHRGREVTVGNGEVGSTTVKLRAALNDIQWGKAEDKHGWLTGCE